MALMFVDQAELKDKSVIARFDFNVPLDKNDRTKITDTSRIDLALETIQFILNSGPKKLIMMSHLGRPDGKPNEKYSLEPVAKYLSEKLNKEIFLTASCVDAGIKEFLKLKETKIVLLENLRFLPEEEANDMEFASKLASYADVYVNDAFGAAHRKHASVHAINRFFKGKAYAGLLMKKEILALDKILNNYAKPFVGVVGGAKVSDKIKTIERLLTSVNHLIIGGAMAYPFLKAKGHTVGTSLCSDEDLKLATQILKADKANKIVLPLDHLVSVEFGGKSELQSELNIPEGKMGLDIGPKSIEHFAKYLLTAKTVLWNGPMGLFENAEYAKGTMSIAKAIADSQAFSVVGGGDSVSAVQKSGFADKFSHISTGGGASLEYIEKSELPGIQALKFGV